MRQLMIFVILLFIAGCNPASSPRWSDKPLSDREEKALAAVIKVFQQNEIRVLDDYGTERQVVGAQMAVMPCKCACDPATGGKEAAAGHEHQDMHEVPHPEGHLVTLITKALIEPKKEYSQPTVNLDNTLYFYKIIYIATVDDKTIQIRKTAAREDADERKEEPVEPALLQHISAAAGGVLQESSVTLP